MQFTKDLNTVTYTKIAPRVVDNITRSTTFASLLSGKAKSWGGGPLQIEPVQTSLSPTGGFINSMDTISLAVTNTMQSLAFGPSLIYQSITIGDAEEGINEHNLRAAVRLLDQKQDAAANSLRMQFGSSMYSTGGGATIDGLENIVDDGTNTASYGGVQRSTNPWVNAQVHAAAGGVLSLNTIGLVMDDASASGIASETPDFMVTDPSVWRAIEGLFSPTNQGRYMSTGVKAFDAQRGGAPSNISLGETQNGIAGFVGFGYRGADIFKDDAAPEGNLYILNSRYLNLYKAPLADFKPIDSNMRVTRGVDGGAPSGDINSSAPATSGEKFPSIWQFRDFMRMPNQLARSAVITFFGQLTSNQPRRQGKITGITSASM